MPAGCRSTSSAPGRARRARSANIDGSVEDLSWSPNGRRLLVLAADLGADRAGIQAATKIQEQGAKEEDPKVTRPFEAWRRLYTIDVETGATEEVGPEGVHVFEVDWDGERAVAICAGEPTESAWYGATSRCSTWTRAPPSGSTSPNGRSSARSWQATASGSSRDSARIAAFSPARPRWSISARREVQDIAVGEHRRLVPGPRRRRSHLVRRPARDGKRVRIAVARPARWTSFGPAMPWSALASSRIVAAGGDRWSSIFESPDRAPEVVELDDGEWRALSDLNGDDRRSERRREDGRRGRGARADGLEIEGLLLVPRRGRAPYPLIVCVHGGPTGRWSW